MPSGTGYYLVFTRLYFRRKSNSAGVTIMQLSPHQTERFYRIWFALFHYVNEQRQLVHTLPDVPTEGSISPPDAFKLRNALWADDTLRDRFIATNPAGLPATDLALVESWRYRLAGTFFIVRH